MAKKKKFEISVVMPEGYSVSEIREYIRDAVANWSGQIDPEDTLFYAFDSKATLTIKPIKSTEFYKQRN